MEQLLSWIIIAIIFAILLFIAYKQAYKETFNERYGTRCFECKNKTFGECMECSDCGYCLSEGNSQCMKGDVHGPYKGDCIRWIHNDPWSSHQFVNK